MPAWFFFFVRPQGGNHFSLHIESVLPLFTSLLISNNWVPGLPDARIGANSQTSNSSIPANLGSTSIKCGYNCNYSNKQTNKQTQLKSNLNIDFSISPYKLCRNHFTTENNSFK